MKKIRKLIGEEIHDYLEESLKWVVMSLLIGIPCGLLGTLFHHSLRKANALRAAHPWLLFTLPLIGALIILLYHSCGMHTDRGTNRILDSVRKNEPVPLRVGFSMFISTILTQLGGGSAGREGAALQIGGSIGSLFSHKIGSRFDLPERSQKVGVMCGMGAFFSALFGTPLTATVFSIEVAEVGHMEHLGLLPTLLSSLIAYSISKLLGGEHIVLLVTSQLTSTPTVMLSTAVLALLCAFVSILFCFVMHHARAAYNLVTTNSYLRVILGGIIVIAVTLFLDTPAFNGAGMNLVEEAVAGNSHWATFLIKLLLTAVTLGAGFKGGEIVPSFAVGASFGCVVAPLLGLDASLGAALGMVAVFCGVSNCPFASIFLGVELCGSRYVVLFAIVCAVSLLFSGNCSLYSSQRILNDKFDLAIIPSVKKKESADDSGRSSK